MRTPGGRKAAVAIALVVALAGASTASAKKPVASIADTEVNEPATAGDTAEAKFTVSLSKSASETVKIIFDTGGDTASPGDYTPATGTLTIPKGKDKAKIRIEVTGDDQVEGDEAFSLSIYKKKNAKISKNRSSASGTIIDAD